MAENPRRHNGTEPNEGDSTRSNLRRYNGKSLASARDDRALRILIVVMLWVVMGVTVFVTLVTGLRVLYGMILVVVEFLVGAIAMRFAHRG
jgi:uncharacterized membrane protein